MQSFQSHATFLFTAAKEVMFSLCLFVCLLAGLRKTTQPIFTKFSGKVLHGPRQKLLDFGGNPLSRYVRVRVTVELGIRLTFHVSPGRTVLRLGEAQSRSLGRVIPATLGLLYPASQ